MTASGKLVSCSFRGSTLRWIGRIWSAITGLAPAVLCHCPLLGAWGYCSTPSPPTDGWGVKIKLRLWNLKHRRKAWFFSLLVSWRRVGLARNVFRGQVIIFWHFGLKEIACLGVFAPYFIPACISRFEASARLFPHVQTGKEKQELTCFSSLVVSQGD